MTNLRNAICFSLLLLATVPLALAQGTYTQIDVPGSSNTYCWGIDTAGDVVGYYLDASSGAYYGYVLSNGNYTTIQYQGELTTSTFLRGINDVGQMVGNTDEAAFSYDSLSGTFTTLPMYNNALTYPSAINNAGVIVSNSYGDIGVKLVGSTYTKILPPTSPDSWVQGITAGGGIVGFAFANNQVFSFSYHAGKYKEVLRPYTGFEIYGISSSGKSIVGYGNQNGFLYQDGTMQTLAFPGATATYATGVNEAGEVVGWFIDSSIIYHGFTWTPPAAAEKK
jgi:probable HAF family extracellular repeat protein